MLTFELLISRVMSAVAYYHFAFMAICLAMFGMTVGAVLVHTFKEVLTRNYAKTFEIASLSFAFTLLINLLCVCYLKPFNIKNYVIHPPYWNLYIIFLTITVPFIFCGTCLSLTFERFSDKANKVYFIDLIGASLGCLLFIPTINLLGVVNTYLFLMFLCLLAAYLFRTDKKTVSVKYIVLLLVVFGSLMAINQRMNMIDLKWIKGENNNLFFYKKWNSYSYIRLQYEGEDVPPRGWSFGPEKNKELSQTMIEQMRLDIDGGAGTAMTNFSDRDLTKIKFLSYDLTSLPYHLVKNGNALIIGVGAGRDILTALLFDQRSITGIEINKTILNIHRTLAAKFSGDLSRHPKVTLINSEARSYINASDKKFDIIQISLIDTFASTQAGAYALSENNLYTTEAIKTYWDHLTDQGMMSITYWTFPYLLKVVGSAAEVLDKSGIQKPMDHFILIHSHFPPSSAGTGNLLIKKVPFTRDEIAVVEKYCKDMGFYFALSGMGTPYVELANVSDMKRRDNYVKDYFLNIAPATDDKPFFFLVTKLNILKSLREFKLLEVVNAEQILASLLAIMLILTTVFVILPLARISAQSLSGVNVVPFALYFTAIGLGFMFIEMTQITRLSSFLGHPTYSLALALFTFLFASGIGSLTLGSVDNKQLIRIYSYAFLVFCILSALYTAPLLHHSSKFIIQIRVFIAVVLLFPLAFFMGSFLPQGIKLLSRQKAPVALFWGLNGATSVLGSILAMITQIQYGLNATFLLGTALYGIAVLLLFYLSTKYSFQDK